MTDTVWSCGGGTQSAAIAALIVSGKLPKPDAAVMADTGREASATWRYFDRVLKPKLSAVGVDLVRLPHSFDGKGWNTVDLWSGKNKNTIVMPMYTAKENKMTEGKLPKYCSNEWKSRPVDRYLRSLGLTGGDIWIGFSTDELQRMRHNQADAKWKHAYPLVDLKLTRSDCISLVRDMGWEEPPRSSCWMCPYRTDAEWRHMKKTDPEDFASAVTLEKEIQRTDPDAFFHDSVVPLDQADFNDRQADIFDVPCSSGMCFT